jgi:hypothetical protein
MIGLSLTLLSTLFAPTAATTPEAAVRALTTAMDGRNAEQVDALLHPDYRVTFAIAGKPGASILDRATYLKLLKAGKIGGAPRTYAAGWSNAHPQFAQVQAVLTGAHARFDMVFTVVKTEAGWQVISESTRMVPAKK